MRRRRPHHGRQPAARSPWQLGGCPLRRTSRRRSPPPGPTSFHQPCGQPTNERRSRGEVAVDVDHQLGVDHREEAHPPPGPTPEITELATVAPATKFTFDARGCGDPHGNTVTKPWPREVTVTVRPPPRRSLRPHLDRRRRAPSPNPRASRPSRRTIHPPSSAPGQSGTPTVGAGTKETNGDPAGK